MPELRTLLSRVTVAEAEALANKAMALCSADEIAEVLDAEVQRLLPSEEFGE